MQTRNTKSAFYTAIVFFISLIPFLWLAADTVTDNLGSNPIETLHFRLGDWALRFLCITLALTPIKLLTGKNWPLRYRRMMGLYSFFYAALHFLVYIGLDLSLSWEQFVDEIPQSPYILVGLFTFLILSILAATSSKSMQRRLGKNWKKLHRLIYLAAGSAVIHYFWLVKADYREPLFYAAIVALLLSVRVIYALKNSGRQKIVGITEGG